MSKMIEWFKAHPLAGGLVVFGVGLIFVLALFGGSKDSTGSAVVVSDGSNTQQGSALAAAQLNASTQIAAAQINAGVQIAGVNAALEAQKSQDSSAVTLGSIQADTTKYVYTLQAQNDAASIQATKDINSAQMSTAQQVALIQAGASTTIAALQADVQSQGQIIAGNVANTAAQYASSTALGVAQINADTVRQGQVIGGFTASQANQLDYLKNLDNIAANLKMNEANNNTNLALGVMASNVANEKTHFDYLTAVNTNALAADVKSQGQIVAGNVAGLKALYPNGLYGT